jgi:outer membrane murein-binding lipoprotein Lpp
LNAEIEQCNVDIRALTARIEELDEDVDRWAKDQAAASAVREKEGVDFKATVSDYAESLEALAGAIQVLKKQDVDKPQAALIQSLMQVSRMSLVPVSTKKALAAFLQQPVADSIPDAMPADNLAVSAPEANAYEFQSGGVVDMLVKLEDEFKTKKAELEEEELKAQHAFQQIMQQLADNTENAEHEINKKTTLRAETEEQKATAKGDLEQTRQDRSEDMTYKADTEALCAQKTADFNSRQKLRGEELDAINKAMEIIGSGAVKGSGDKHLPALLQTKKTKTSMAQLRSSQQDQSPLQARIADFLAERARVTGSSLLAQVSTRVAADPFKKVKKMIKDLISKLTQEATEEAESKGWCDTEVTTNTQTRTKKTEEVNQLTSEIEDLTATIAQLTQDISDLTTALAQLADEMAKETAERSASKADNEQAISDAKAAQTAVEEAMAVLKDFYAKSAEATAFTQRGPADDAPETFEKPYTGMGTSGGNVVDFLEVILSDFARLESETSTDEAMETDEYKTFMFESEKDQALKTNEMKHKTEKKTSTESGLHSAQEELKLTQEALDKAVAYYEKLKPSCVDTGITYEERVKRREAEMQSLQEALKILSGTDVDVA